MPTLATIEDYYVFLAQTYPPTPALTAEQIAAIESGLSRATPAVVRALRTATYARDTDGLPLVTAQRDAIAQAVSAQYAAVLASGQDPSGAAPVYDSVSALGVSFSQRSGNTAQNRSWGVLDGIAPEARDILINAQFFSTAVQH
jgi:hypothetical protein